MLTSGITYLLLFSLQFSLLHAQDNQVYQQGMLFKKKGNMTEAAKLLGKALEADPGNKMIAHELADALYEKRDYFHAIPVYEELIQQDEENIDYLVRLSEMYSMSPQKRKSIDYAEKALALKPADGQALCTLARSYLEVKHFPKAISLYQQAEKIMENDRDIPYKIANCYAEMSNFRQASVYFDRCLKLDPDNATKIYETANNCYDNNEFEKALTLYQLAEDKGYYPSTQFYDNWANACIVIKDFNRALFYFSKAKEFAPYDRNINLSIAETYSYKGDYKKCREIIQELLAINPEDAEALYTLGMSYYKDGQRNKAENYFNKAFEIDPSLLSLRYVKTNF